MNLFQLSVAVLALLFLLLLRGTPTGAESQDQVLQEDKAVPPAGKDSNEINQSKDGRNKQADVSPIDLYRRLLRQKRLDQLEAVKRMTEIDAYDRQYKFVQLLLQKISKVLQDSKVKLMEAGYTPGDEFPTEENIRDALSMVIENTAFFGDVLLRIPDITHKLLLLNKEWDLLLKWGISFVNETGILQEGDSKLLNLMAQELELIPRDPSYVNPFKESTKMFEDIKFEKKSTKKKKKNKKLLQKGPRLQGSRNEL